MTATTNPSIPDAGPGGNDKPGLDFRLGEWLVQPSLDRISRAGETHRLEPKVMDVLVLLARRGGVVAHAEILAGVWAKKFMARTVVPRAIAELRRVLGDDAQAPRYIETIPKRGYRLVAAVLPAEGGGAGAEPETRAPRHLGGRGAAGPVATVPPVPARPRYAVWLAVSALAIVSVVGLVGGVIARLGEAPWPSASGLAAPSRTLAVLPFRNASGDPHQEYLAAGLTEALVTSLLNGGELRVRGLGSTLPYRNTAKRPSEIARELRVEVVLDGTLEQTSDRVRITARLIDGASDGVMWTGTYDRDPRDALELQEDVAAVIAREVQAKLRPPEVAVPALGLKPRPVFRLLAYR